MILFLVETAFVIGVIMVALVLAGLMAGAISFVLWYFSLYIG